ncbi:hypothetical protein [Rhizobium leguminosarum]
MIGAVADDEFVRTLAKNLHEINVDRRFVRTLNGAASGMSVAISGSEGDYGAVIASGTNLQLGEKHVETAAELFKPNAILVLPNEVPNVAAAVATQLGMRLHQTDSKAPFHIRMMAVQRQTSVP